MSEKTFQIAEIIRNTFEEHSKTFQIVEIINRVCEECLAIQKTLDVMRMTNEEWIAQVDKMIDIKLAGAREIEKLVKAGADVTEF